MEKIKKDSLKGKVLAILIIVAMLLSMTPVTFAASPVTFSAVTDKTSVKNGDNFTITINISNNSGFSALNYDLYYDSDKVQFVEMESSLFSEHNDNKEKSRVSFAFASAKNYSGNGVIAKAKFKVKDDAKTGNIEFKQGIYEIADENDADVESLPKQDYGRANLELLGDLVTVTDGIKNVAMKSTPNKLEYDINDTKLDVSGGKLIVTMDDNTTKEVSLTADMCSNYDLGVVGEHPVTVSYGGKSIENAFTITVTDPQIAVVEGLIKALKPADQLTLQDKNQVVAARTAYDKLAEASQKLVDKTVYEKLVAAEGKMTALEGDKEKVDNVIRLIDAVKNIDSLTYADKVKVDAAKAAYDALGDLQAQIPGTSLTALNNAVDRMVELVQAEQDKADAAAVDALIAALPQPAKISDEEQVTTARTAYTDLNEQAKGFVTKLADLVAAEEKIASLKKEADAAKGLIEAIPAQLTLGDKGQVEKAKAAYDALDTDQKALVGDELAAKLSEAVTTMSALVKEAEDKAVAAEFTAMVEGFNNPLTLADKAAVSGARSFYSEMSDDAKQYVTEDTLSALAAAEAEITRLQKIEDDKAAAKPVSEAIAALPEALTLDHRGAVQGARAAYDKLTNDQKAYVTNLSKLTEAEAKIAELAQTADKKAEALSDALAAFPTEPATPADTAVLFAADDAYAELDAAEKSYLEESKPETMQAYRDAVTAAKAVNHQVDEISLGNDVPWYVVLQKTDLTEEAVISGLTSQAAGSELLGLYDLNLLQLNRDGELEPFVPTEKIQFRVIVADGDKYENFRLIHDLGAGEYDIINAVGFVDGAAIFELDSFSPYALAADVKPLAVDDPNQSTAQGGAGSATKTGDETNLPLYLLLLALSGAGLVALKRKVKA